MVYDEYKDDHVFQEFRRELLSREITTDEQMDALIEKLKIGDNEKWIDYIRSMDGVEIETARRKRRGGERSGQTVYKNLVWEKSESFYDFATRIFRNK